MKRIVSLALSLILAIGLITPLSFGEVLEKSGVGVVKVLGAEEECTVTTVEDVSETNYLSEYDENIDKTLALEINGVNNYDYANAVLEQMNELRSSLGIKALTMDEELLSVAMQRAAEIAIYYSHTRPDDSSCFSFPVSGRAFGENIAIGYTSPSAVMNGWTNSSGHYANMTDSDFNAVGVGCFEASDGTLCWVQFFTGGATPNKAEKSGSVNTTHTVKAKNKNLNLSITSSKYDLSLAKKGDVITFDVINRNVRFGYQSQKVSSSFNFESLDSDVIEINNGVGTVTGDGTVEIKATLKDDVQFSLESQITIGHNHTYSRYYYNNDATCVSDGTKTAYCDYTNCTETDTVQANGTKLDHSYGGWVVIKEPTCTEKGERSQTCTNCGNVKTEILGIISHKYSTEWIIDIAPTCATTGSKYKQCADCGEIIEFATIPATGHTVIIDAAVAPTCTKSGKTEGSHCAVCNAVIKAQITVGATGHKLSDWVVDKAATCTTDGFKYKQCLDCGEIIEFATIYAFGHTEVVDAAVAPTCTQTGKTEGSHCAVCNAVIKAQFTVGVAGHELSDWIVDQEATVYKAGSQHKECSVCAEELEIEEIPQLKCAKPVLKEVYNANSYVKVTWGAVEGADLYRVYRKTGTGDYEYIGSTTHTYLNDKEAGAGKTCRYIVKAKNEAGNSEASASIAIKHVDEPTLKSIENSAYGVLIKWDKVTGVEKYNVYRKVSGGEYKYIGATDKAYYTDKTAESGTKYYYAIRAKRDDSISSQSASLSKYYLTDPTLKTPSSTTSGIKLSWSKVTGAEGYMVYRKTGSGSYTKLATVEGVSTLNYTDKSAQKGKKYTYKVKVYKSKTYSAYSNTKTITDKY